jgi:hypothetical protein
MGKITRRLFLRRAPIAIAAAGAVVSGAALAVPVADAGKPVFVKVGSPSFSISAEQATAVAKWNAAKTAKEAVDEVYFAWTATVPKTVRLSDMPDQTVRNAWIDADDNECSTRWAMLRALRNDVRKVGHIQ